MFLKRLKLTNYRKFSSEKNIVEFISSKIVLNQDKHRCTRGTNEIK